MALNAYLNRFRSVKRCEMFEPCNVVECLGHFEGIVPSLVCILTKQHGVHGGKYLLKTPGNTISETLNFKMSLDALALKNLYLWCEFQSRLIFIISLLLKNILTALLRLGCFPILVVKINSLSAVLVVYNSYYTQSKKERTEN